ncbi:glutathione S-transferase family protein [Phragmitibacter flavus]|uniref:Glutathione S-transferase family protein n=1 Tax=Phragmitibacter flavus TaxID=2576071 RepID=A0A5R8KJE8_9BACT|nr:glutathione S-transferase family protein [Phragmitibacter flavus]TLD72446.1 glutathione S-transferase family protein [Phragmitibacter flavus]
MNPIAQFPQEQSTDGSFERQDDAFRNFISPDPNAPHPAVAGRYHLYVSLACPWASRALIVRNLKGLQDIVSMSVIDPIRDHRGWAFREGDGYTTDPINLFQYLSEAYHASDPHFNGRVTVPVLWDKVANTILNNSEDDICQMFNTAFANVGANPLDLFPSDLEPAHTELADFIYQHINNGVYKAGFASTQSSYEKPVRELFNALDQLETRLTTSRYLFGNRIVEADWRLFCTLVRFDAVYHGHFKCNLKRIIDYPNLNAYLLDLYQQPGIADTVNIDHIKRHYYFTHHDINPTQVVPLGPILDFTQPHGRESLSSPSRL